MSSTATKSGLVIIFLSMTVVQGQQDWGVTYSSTQICALKGMTVDIPCTYIHPPNWGEHHAVPVGILWFTRMNGSNPVDLRSEPDYTGRVEYHFHENGCTLRITDLTESDAAEYKIRLIMNHQDDSVTESPGVTLSVTDLHVTVINSTEDRAELKCHSSCHPGSDQLSYIWYRNGRMISKETASVSVDIYPADSFACALKGHEDFHSPAVCVKGENCNRVTYTDRKICTLEGSSVDISCTYNSYSATTSNFWFSPERSSHWRFPSNPEDLREDSEFSGRVQVVESESGHSTLRITDLRLTDSAQYHFKFKTNGLEWHSVLPATTLTVTALQVQVNTESVHRTSDHAELKCHSSCSPAGHQSYIWFKNGEKIQTETATFLVRLDSVDSYACALRGYEDFPSPPVYALNAPSVSASPPGEITEGSSVTLNCSSDANIKATYTWYKRNQALSCEKPQLIFTSIQSSDSGEYHCAAENELGRRASKPISVDVNYPPKLPSVSVSPSAEIDEGSSVTLTCSSDANPAANYTWYKENEIFPQALGQTFTITDFSASNSGNYYCEAHNGIGFHNSTSILIVVSGDSILRINVIRLTLLPLVLIPLLLLILWSRKKKTLSSTSEPVKPAEMIELNPSPKSEDISAVPSAQAEDTEEQEDIV
ncbi:Hypothetical predicted protein [Xyrichtys novacula]|uniref:B-cell receptor CD22 n=1 Tax=Xyrichtys novacula TaxID=13765 RepID=A0AAV1EWI4_XYRNO|nr:Hypothetical predicted protein [Xyrichtys novacula]